MPWRAVTPVASYTSPWESVATVNDGVDPAVSHDTQNRRWGTWPNTGQQWVDLTWSSAQTVRAVEVNFFDDGSGVRVPASWRVQAFDGNGFTDVSAASGYPTVADRYNVVTFAAVGTTRLRILLTSGSASVGLLEVKAQANPPGSVPSTPASSAWNPPAHLVTPVTEAWQHYEQTYPRLTNWMDVMVGHNGWPYQEVPLKVVGWAVRDRAQLQWTDSSVNNIRENAPQCSNCAAGSSRAATATELP